MAVFTSCIWYIFHYKCQITDFYLVELNDNGDFDMFEKVTNVTSLVPWMLLKNKTAYQTCA